MAQSNSGDGFSVTWLQKVEKRDTNTSDNSGKIYPFKWLDAFISATSGKGTPKNCPMLWKLPIRRAEIDQILGSRNWVSLSPRTRLSPGECKYVPTRMGNELIQQANSSCYLGVRLDPKLDHLKLRQIFWMLRSRSHITVDNKRLLY